MLLGAVYALPLASAHVAVWFVAGHVGDGQGGAFEMWGTLEVGVVAVPAMAKLKDPEGLGVTGPARAEEEEGETFSELVTTGAEVNTGALELGVGGTLPPAVDGFCTSPSDICEVPGAELNPLTGNTTALVPTLGLGEPALPGNADEAVTAAESVGGTMAEDSPTEPEASMDDATAAEEDPPGWKAGKDDVSAAAEGAPDDEGAPAEGEGGPASAVEETAALEEAADGSTAAEFVVGTAPASLVATPAMLEGAAEDGMTASEEALGTVDAASLEGSEVSDIAVEEAPSSMFVGTAAEEAGFDVAREVVLSAVDAAALATYLMPRTCIEPPDTNVPTSDLRKQYPPGCPGLPKSV
ncbi:hypothetical protein H2203_005098 [Taxawa tesnikishii (nom. ined.)]|nr:hypothetical protein H2203_005098 [Dothideales sp. JES 119]